MASSEMPENRAVVSEMVSLLTDLFDTDERMVISNKSLRLLIDYLSRELNDAISNGKQEDLLRQWRQNLPIFRENMMKLAKQGEFVMENGVRIPLMTEGKSAILTVNLKKCPPPPMD